MELILLGLMGLGSLAFMLDAEDDTTAADPTGKDDGGQPGSGTDTNGGQTGGTTAPPAAAGRTFELESGGPNPTGTSGNDTFTGIVEGTVRGGAGNDRFEFENGYGAVIFGGAGNDTLGNAGDSFTLYGEEGDDLIAFTANVYDGAAAYGGTGNDTLSVQIPDFSVNAAPSLGGGGGNDVFDLDFDLSPSEGQGKAGLVVLKDYTPGQDRLEIAAEGFTRAELSENADGNYTDLLLYQSGTNGDGTVIERVSTIRLEGITGTSLKDLGVTLPDDDPTVGRLYEVSSGGLSRVDGGLSDDTIRGIADYAGLFGGGGNDVFEIEDGDSATLDGGLGDDNMTIDLARQFNIFGGAGNDVINVDATSNIEESSIIDGGDGDDRLDIDIRLNDPFAEGVDTVSGGAGADTFSLNLADFSYGSDFTSDQMLVVKDLTTSEDDLEITIGAGAAPFYKGATLVPNAQDGSTDLVLTFERSDGTGVLRQWTGIVKLLDTKNLVLADDGPVRVLVAA